MSADNGIYILKTKDKQYRVIHTTAIGNLYYSYLDPENDKPMSTRIIEYFGQSASTYDKNLARNIAFNMMRNTHFVEYGIREIYVNKTWEQIVKEAKEIAPLEIKVIKDKEYADCWESEVTKLKEIINM